ncbi:MAG: rhomboid family intramembrane serine protease [Chlamydiia bacterium]|nr:rhomboid family intramembrane serine protease [Chlamydiia bacterium]
MKQKIRHIILPTLFWSLALLGIYTPLNWLLFIHLDLISLRQEVTNFGLPLFFAALIVLLVLKHRIDLLNFKSRMGYYAINCLITMFGLIAIPTVIAQEYLTTATGKLHHLERISAINGTEKGKFYTVDQCFISKHDLSAHIETEVQGKHNEHLAAELFIALPIYDSLYDFSPPSAWLGVRYSEKIGNWLSEQEKEQKFEEFVQRSEEKLIKRDLQQFTYLTRIGHSNALNAYSQAIQNSPKFSSENAIVLIPNDRPFEERFGDKLFWIYALLIAGPMGYLILLSGVRVDEERLDAFLQGDHIGEEESSWTELLSHFKPRKSYFTTPILLNLNIAIYLLLFMSGAGFFTLSHSALIEWGANSGEAVAAGEYHRLILSTFLHDGIMHLAFNMFALFLVGFILEPILGSARFLFAYLLAGILASMASNYWYENFVSVGASGAIFGMYGVLFAWNLMGRIRCIELTGSVLPFLWCFVPINLVAGLFLPNIDNAGHLGGLFCGLVLGCLWKPRDVEEYVEEDESA